MRSLQFSSKVLGCLFTLLVIAKSSLGAPDTPIEIKPLSDERAKEYKLDAAFYKKCALNQNILIATSDKVSDYAHLEAAYLAGPGLLAQVIVSKYTDDTPVRVRDACNKLKYTGRRSS